MPKVDDDYTLVKVKLLEMPRNRSFYYQVPNYQNVQVGDIYEGEFQDEGATLMRVVEIVADPTEIENERWTLKTLSYRP